MCTFYVNSNFRTKGRVYKFGKSFGRVPKNKTCVVNNFSIKDRKIVKEGEVFIVDQIFVNSEPIIYFITKNF
jgi:hypothetical protein